MDTQIRDLGNCKKELTVTVPAATVDAELEKAFEQVRQQVVFPGFRPGKAPRMMVEKKYGDHVRSDVTADLINNSVNDAIKSHEIEIVSEPEVAGEPPKAEIGTAFTFTFTVEVKPTFDLPNYRGLAVERRVKAVTDADVDRVIGDMRKKKGVLKPVEGDGYTMGDFALVDWVAHSSDGTVVQQRRSVAIGGDDVTVPDLHIESLPVALAGKKPGEPVKLDAELTLHHHGDDHDHGHGHDHGHDHAHEQVPVQVTITIQELKRPELPPLDDEFAKPFNQESLAALRADIARKLTAAHQAASDAEVGQKLVDQLVKAAPFEMATGPVDRAVDRRIQRATLERMMSGADEEAARAAVTADREKIREIIERDARAWLIVERLAKKEKIFALEDDVTKEIERIAREHDSTPTQIREYYEEHHLLAELRAEIVERKVLDFLRSHAVITDVSDGGATQAASA